MNRYSVTPGALQLDSNGGFVAYDDHVREVEQLKTEIADYNERRVLLVGSNERQMSRMLERAQRAERQVINAARALGYIDDAG